MAFYIRKRVTIAPGVALNVSKSGLGLSVGPKGFKVSAGPRGVQLNAGQGGIYYRKTLNTRGRRTAQSQPGPAAVGQHNGVAALRRPRAPLGVWIFTLSALVFLALVLIATL